MAMNPDSAARDRLLGIRDVRGPFDPVVERARERLSEAMLEDGPADAGVAAGQQKGSTKAAPTKNPPPAGKGRQPEQQQQPIAWSFPIAWGFKPKEEAAKATTSEDDRPANAGLAVSQQKGSTRTAPTTNPPPAGKGRQPEQQPQPAARSFEPEGEAVKVVTSEDDRPADAGLAAGKQKGSARTASKKPSPAGKGRQPEQQPQPAARSFEPEDEAAKMPASAKALRAVADQVRGGRTRPGRGER